MLMFTSNLIFLLALAVFAGGMVLLHFAASGAGSKWLKIAGIVLVVGSIGSAACLTYYSLKYWFQGAYDTAQAGMGGPMMMRHMMMKDMTGGGMMMNGMGKGGMMGPKSPQPGTPPREETPPADAASPEEHEQHH